jgi:hypothetical protein
MRRTRRLVAFFCIVAILLAALAPSHGSDPAVLTLAGALPPVVLVVLARASNQHREPPIPLVSLDASRAPPTVPA